jgi:hypothetical protein
MNNVFVDLSNKRASINFASKSGRTESWTLIFKPQGADPTAVSFPARLNLSFVSYNHMTARKPRLHDVQRQSKLPASSTRLHVHDRPGHVLGAVPKPLAPISFRIKRWHVVRFAERFGLRGRIFHCRARCQCRRKSLVILILSNVAKLTINQEMGHTKSMHS